jgi:hypothetical protein
MHILHEEGGSLLVNYVSLEKNPNDVYREAGMNTSSSRSSSTTRRDRSPSAARVSPADFDRWSQAVREQMLDCLRRRSDRNAEPSASDRT